jgi:hypothetical protein
MFNINSEEDGMLEDPGKDGKIKNISSCKEPINFFIFTKKKNSYCALYMTGKDHFVVTRLNYI